MIKKIIMSILITICIVSLPLNVFASEPSLLDSEEGMLGGASITMLQNRTRSQISSFMIKTKSGKLIIVDGGVKGDANYLAKKITENGGTVAAWFITHPHDDHIGALSDIITDSAHNITIEGIYYSFPTIPWVLQKESQYVSDIMKITEALGTLPQEILHSDIKKGDQIEIDGVNISVLTEWKPHNMPDSVNNSSIVFKMEINSKKIMFLGDLGPEGARALLEEYPAEELKADIVQMAHHGQNLGRELYAAIDPEICMWPTPTWLWFNNSGKGHNSGPWNTMSTRKIMNTLNVKTHLISKDGDHTVY